MTNVEAGKKILSEESNKTLHYIDITIKAIEKGYIPPVSDSRKTPERTMYSELYRSIKKSIETETTPVFNQLGGGFFSLNIEEDNRPENKNIVPTASQQIKEIIFKHNSAIKEEYAILITKLDPFVFEELIGTYLEVMGYEDVVVTKKSHDGGVDVVANVNFGINEMKVVVQVKRYKQGNNIDVDTIRALRGAFSEHNAVQGVLVTTSDFTKNAMEIAKVNPLIMPISGQILVEQLINKGIGINKGDYGLLSIDREFFDNLTENNDS